MKTSVRKFKGMWCVTYYIPYGGILEAQFPSWKEAMADAISIEVFKAST